MAKPDRKPVNHSAGRLSVLSLLAAACERAFAFALLAIIAGIYGATNESDTYFLALVIPVAIGAALADGLYTTFLPRFSFGRVDQASLARALWFSSAAGTAFMFLYVGAVMAAAPNQLSVWLVLAPLVPAVAVAATYAAFLVARRRYAAAVARVPIASALAILVICALLPFSKSPFVLGAGTLIGYVGALVVLIVVTRGGAKSCPSLGPPHSTVGAARASGLVALAALLSGPVVVVVERSLAAGLAPGSIALLTFARNLALLPLMISQALASGMFPAATTRRELVDHESLNRLVISGMRFGLLACLIASAFLVVCRRDVVRVALERGSFTSSDAAAVAKLLLVFAGAVIGLTVAAVSARGLFALGRYGSVTLLNALSFTLYVVVAIPLRNWRGQEGLAIAFLVSSLVGGVVAALVLLRSLEVSLGRFGMEAILWPSVMASLFAVGAYSGLRVLPLEDPSLAMSLARIALSGGAGLLAFGGLVVLLRTDEYRLIARLVRLTRHA